MTGPDVPVFAYPSGATSPGVAEAVAAAGLRIAFTTARGVNDLRSASWLSLRRINVSVHTPGPPSGHRRSDEAIVSGAVPAVCAPIRPSSNVDGRLRALTG